MDTFNSGNGAPFFRIGDYVKVDSHESEGGVGFIEGDTVFVGMDQFFKV